MTLTGKQGKELRTLLEQHADCHLEVHQYGLGTVIGVVCTEHDEMLIEQGEEGDGTNQTAVQTAQLPKV